MIHKISKLYLKKYCNELINYFEDNITKATKGHAGNNGGGHFTVAISSNEFTGKSLMERHRMVYQLMHDLIPEKIHALSIKAISPDD